MSNEIALSAISRAGRLLPGRRLADHRKPRILSLGGCLTHDICKAFGNLAEHKHLWRVTVPGLVAQPAIGRSLYKSDSFEVSERLNYELTKQALQISAQFAPDIIMIDPTSDLPLDYYEKDGCIIPDFASGMVTQGKIEWPPEFPIAEWSRLSPLSPRYTEIYIAGLKQMLSLDFVKRADVLFLQRRACSLTISADGFSEIHEPSISRINSFVTDLFDTIRDEVPGLKVVKFDEEMMFTSKDAPWGEWLFHPVEEFYDYAANEIASMYGLKGRYLTALFKDRYAQRVQRRRIKEREYETLSAEHQKLVEERDALVAQQDALVTQRDALVVEHDILAGKHEAVASERQALAEERDARVAQSDALQAQHQSLAGQHEAVAAERQTLAEERDALIAQRDALLAERDTLARQHEAVATERQTLAEERDALITQRDALLAERDTLAGQHEAVAAERQTLAEERDALIAQRDLLIAARDTLASQKDTVAAERQAIAEERDARAFQCEVLAVERDALLGRHDTVASEHQALAKELDALAAQRDALLAERDALLARQGRRLLKFLNPSVSLFDRQ
ncbi:hypothetical protein [Reyranella sp.]|uniref:hypothetical protein n=1 Tax=Reyranella sp. TaxID=1929291 RepID=UPI00120FEDF4|nr:hypothetical protein [Reyranella sp.]TAJ91000.1 MAG: hypothetical protein EPO50_00270 [Reyranella sp.]